MKKANKAEISSEISVRLFNISIFSSDIDEIIDAFRTQYNIVIYNSYDPYVSPVKEDYPIVFGYTIKKCFPGTQNGWNRRIYIGKTEQSDDLWEVKRDAILMALEYVEKRTTGNVTRKSVPYF